MWQLKNMELLVYIDELQFPRSADAGQWVLDRLEKWELDHLVKWELDRLAVIKWGT